MDPHRDALRSFVRALVQRERLLLLGRVLLQSLGLILTLLLVAVLVAILGADRSAAAVVLVLTAGIGSFFAVFVPLYQGWRRSGDVLRQARRVEAMRPTLEGRLLTVVERLDGPRGQESEAILGLVARRAQERLRGLSPGRVHRSWPLAVGAAGILVLLIVTLSSSLFAPGGPVGALRFWLRGDPALAALDDALGPLDPDHARVGDLVLEYVYPTYTGLEPLVVENSTGEAHGPPGTRVTVRARSAEPVDAAAVIAYGQPGEGSRVEGDRLVHGTFTISGDEGTWQLEMHRGESTRTSREFTITPEPDLAPEVILDGPRLLEVALDEPIDLPWQVRDDYGLDRVVVLVDGKEISELRTFEQRTAESSGTLSFTPQQLGMSAGMRVDLQVGAWDNNAWSGSALGLSEPAIELLVKRPEDLVSLSPDKQLELRDVLVDLLAGQLLDPWPPGPWSADVARSGEAFDAKYEPLRTFVDANPAVYRDRVIRGLVRDVEQAGHDFVAYTQVNFDPEQRTERADMTLLVQAAELRDAAIEETEFGVILLDRTVQMRALVQVLEQASTLAGLGDRLERELERNASDAEIQGALERVERSLETMEESVAFMSQDGTRSMVERRQKELDLLRDEVGKQLQAGERDQATELAGRLARQMVELRDDLEYRLKQVEDEENQLAEQMKDLVEELKRLEREQRQLRDQVSESRKAGDAQGSAEAERLWARVEQLATQAVDRGVALEDRTTNFWARKHVSAANQATERLVESARARDLRKARADVNDSLANWQHSYRAIEERDRAPITRPIEEAQRLLQQLQREASSVDPQVASQAQAMRGQQSELAEGLDAVMEQAREVAARMPIEPRGMEEALEQAQGNMGDATEDLGAGRPMPAEGSQGAAAERLKEAREALEQAARQMAASGPGGGEGDGEDEGDDGSNEDEMDLDPGSAPPDRDIDLEEQFDLDAFQRDVLRGARGDVPDAYRALKQRYYEELMTQ